MYMHLRVWEAGNTVFGRLSLPLRGGGSLSVLLQLQHTQVVQALHRMGLRFSPSERAQIGSVFGSIGKFVSKVAKNSMLRGMIKVAKGVANGPLIKLIAPQAALAIEAASGATKLIRAARSGNPKAKLALKAAISQAQLENKDGKQYPVPSSVAAKGPTTAMAFRYLVTVAKVS